MEWQKLELCHTD